MKKYLDIFLIILLVVFGYMAFIREPDVVIQREEVLTKGDTTETVKLKKTIDSLRHYIFNAEPIYKERWHKAVHDTIRDTVILGYTAPYNLGDDTLGVSGLVSFIEELKAFTFDSTQYRYPEITKHTTDTLKINTTITKDKPFYRNNWFYSTLALIGIIVAYLGGK